MAYTTPSTQATGTLVTSTMYKAHIIDNIKFFHGPPTVRVRRLATQTFTASQWTAVAFSSKDWDTNSMFATTGTKVTCKTAGKFLVTWSCGTKGSTTGATRGLGLRKNSTGVGTPTDGNILIAKLNSASNNTQMALSQIVTLTTGQFMEGLIFSDGSSNGVKTSTAINGAPFFSMCWVSS